MKKPKRKLQPYECNCGLGHGPPDQHHPTCNIRTYKKEPK